MTYTLRINQQAECTTCNGGTCTLACKCKCHDHSSLCLKPDGGFTPFLKAAAREIPQDLYAVSFDWSGRQLLDEVKRISKWGHAPNYAPTKVAAVNAAKVAICIAGLGDNDAHPRIASVGLDGRAGLYLGFHCDNDNLLVLCSESGAIALLAISNMQTVRAVELAPDPFTVNRAVEEIHTWLTQAS